MLKYQKLLATLLSVIILSLMTACSTDAQLSPEAQVKQLMQQIESAIESRDKSEIFEHVSEQYQDHKGNDKKALERFATIYLLRNQSIELISNINSIDVLDQGTVAVEVSVLMAGKSANANNVLNQFSADSQSVSAVFKDENGDWKLNSMSWDRQSQY